MVADLNLDIERFRIEGGSSKNFNFKQGDKAEICDPEGLQQCKILILEYPEGEVFDFPYQAKLNIEAPINKGFPFAYIALSEIGPAGQSIEYIFKHDCQLNLEALGADMSPDAQNPATELLINITRANPQSSLPEPLAKVKSEIRIKAASAEAYEIKAGDYIQIIDVDGKQCSDLIAFDAVKLKAGLERPLEPTTTRTLMGAASPTPGLHSKYFDEDFEPMLELIRDTVGRHDTFAIACSAKYYDDMGYPGHDNCSDNFNKVVAPFGINPKKGWPAINFFYNTFVDEHNILGFDEPWSRAGDYVLLRAMKDLVCASSSCADDIDPANAWKPTDIHVRIYDASNNFSKGSAIRMTKDSLPKLTKDSGFKKCFEKFTRYFVEYRGYWLPQNFNNLGAIAEYWACRNKAVIMDLSPLRKFEVRGPDAIKLMQLVSTRDMNKLAIGQVVYSAFCYETGGMIDDGTIYRLGANNFRVIVGDDFVGKWLRDVAGANGFNVFVKSSTDQLHNVAVQGPNSREILSKIVTTPPHQPSIEELKWFRFTIGKIAGCAVMISRTGYTGELGYEIWCHPKDCETIFDAIYNSGEPLGLEPLGLEALDILRIEAGLVFANYDFCDQTDPFEAGIGFAVAAKEDDYIGKEALLRRKTTPARKMVGLEMTDDTPIHHGDAVYVGRAQVGEITSATRSPILGKSIALARLDVSVANIGDKVEIGKLDGQQKRIPATIVTFPHFDPQKTRVRA